MKFYSVRETELTTIADAIRAKTGNTDALTLSDIPAAIEGFDTGGKHIKVSTGEFTPTSSGASVTVAHNMGIKPDLVFGIVDGNFWTTGSMAFMTMSDEAYQALGFTGSQGIRWYSNDTSQYAKYVGRTAGYGWDSVTVTDETITFNPSGTYRLVAKNYRWVAIGGLV